MAVGAGDHKGTDEDEVARIRKLDGFVLHGRVNALLSVTRAIGDCALKPWVTSAPETRREELKSDDDIIVLACDGLWDVVSDDDATRLCREKKDARCTATDCAHSLVQKALREGSSDNVSVIVVFLRTE
jgi:serine/threonine protein phosphatase PrpC